MAAINQSTNGIGHKAIGQQGQAKAQGGLGAAET
jgi:hypothetical protein